MINKNIFQISEEYAQLSAALIESGGEVTDEIETALAINKNDLQVKGIGYGFIVKQIEADCEIIDTEIERLATLKKQRKNAIDRLKNTLSNVMQLYEIEEIKTPLLKINFRNSETTEIPDVNFLDGKYMKTTVTQSPDKTAIKEAIKAGETVTGAFIKQHKNLQIK